MVFIFLEDKVSRKEMLVVSLWTALLGLTEPIFVPEYWMPPSLFNLAEKTGFDIESILFAFGVGGLAVVLYEMFFKARHEKLNTEEMNHSRHRYHLWALLSAPIIFFILVIFTDLNPIYSTFVALIGGGLFTWYCRPDLKKKMLVSAVIFTVFYFIYFLTLELAFPGYVLQVWNMSAISGILIVGIPLEELMFAFSFGFLWSSVYEHMRWYTVK
jgi:hypothetical protein